MAHQNLTLISDRQKAPLWPPKRGAAYQNLSSTDDLPLQETPGTGMSVSKSLLTPKLTPSPLPYTPGLDSTYNTPQIGSQPEKQYEKKKQPWYSWFGYGWRGGARISFCTTLVALIANIIIMVDMTVSYEKMDGFPVVYRGTCESAQLLNTIWHFAINGLSTTVLAASNYSMQLLSAPTRRNVDRAHGQGIWLDIGIPSVRNLRFSSWLKRSLWFLLALSSIPLHLVYNSVFYAAIATNDYNILFATEQFASGGQYDKTKYPDSSALNISYFQSSIQNSASNWTRLNNHDCISEYSHDFVTKYRNLITVVTNVTAEPDDSIRQVLVNELPKTGYLGRDYDAFAWICNDTATKDKAGGEYRENGEGFIPCSAVTTDLMNIANTWWRTSGYDIGYCLAETIEADCHLHFAPHLMGPVILMNLIKVCVMFYVAFRMVDRPLVTLGDAIESFIIHPDPTTRGMCLASAHQLSNTFHTNARAGFPTPNPRAFQTIHHRWHNVVTKRQWFLLGTLFTIMLLSLSLGLVFSTRSLSPPNFSNAWSLGLGKVRTQNLILNWNLPQLGASAVLLTALIANAPQALLSFLYMVYNTIFTLMQLGEDWDLFGAYTSTTRHKLQLASKKQTHRYLRVSDPRGNQKSTHFLALPYRYAIPLLCVSGFLHWLCSQTLYLANISVIPRDGTLPRHDEITTVAFAPQGMVFLLVVAVAMIALTTVYSMRKFGGQMGIVGSNSAAISASCHVEMDVKSQADRQEMVMHKLAWGEIPRDQSDSRFSTLDLGADEDTGRKGPTSKFSESNEAFGLGINEEGREVYKQDDFMHRDPFEEEEQGYASTALRGHAEMVDMDGNSGRSTGVAHCSFSDGFVFKPVVGRLYA